MPSGPLPVWNLVRTAHVVGLHLGEVSAAVDAVGGWPVDDAFREATAGLKRVELVAALGGPWRYVVGRSRRG